MIHIVKGFGIVNKVVDIFLELSCFFDDSMDVGNFISGLSYTEYLFWNARLDELKAGIKIAGRSINYLR